MYEVTLKYRIRNKKPLKTLVHTKESVIQMCMATVEEKHEVKSFKFKKI